MASAQDYKLTPGRGYNPPSHNGKDWATPIGTQVFDDDSRILTGNTGKSTGPHLHTQAGTDEWCQNVIDPTPYEFKPGTVAHVGTASEWGKYVIVKVGSKFICYAHLSVNNVKVGDVIKGGDMYEGKTAKEWYNSSRYYKQKRLEVMAERDKALNDKEFYKNKRLEALAQRDAALTEVEQLKAQLGATPPVGATLLSAGIYEVK